MNARTIFLTIGLAALSGSAIAQDVPAPAAAPAQKPARSRLDARLAVSFGSISYVPKQSLETLVGTASQLTYGVAAEFGLWRGLFVGAAISRGESLTGERVFIHRGTTYKLGIPLTIDFKPLDAYVGWRVAAGRFNPFVAVGMSKVRYEETGGFAAAGDDTSESASGLLLHAGVDVTVWRWIQMGGEIRHRRVTGVLGTGGVSAEFGEDGIGGFALAGRLTIGR